MTSVLHINPVVKTIHMLHGQRGEFHITQYANGFEIWRQLSKPGEVKDAMAWLCAQPGVEKMPPTPPKLRLVK